MPVAAHEYGKAAIPEPFQILGVRLQPLSIHHCILMQRFDVGFTSEAQTEGTVEDLIFSLLICSKKWNEGEFEEYVFSEECERDVAEWAEKIGDDAAKNGTGFPDLTEKIKLFDEYVRYHSEEPKYLILNQSGNSSGAHWSQCVLLTLTGQLGYTRQEALHCPLSQALADYYRYAEMQGIIRLMSQEEIEMFEKAKNGPQPEVKYAN